MSEKDFDAIANNLAQQSLEIQNRLKDAQKIGIESAKDLLLTLEKVRNNADACLSGHKASAQVGSENIDSMRKQLTTTQLSEAQKYQEQIRVGKNDLDSSNKKIAQLEAELQDCIESRKKTTPIGPQQLEQIRKLEQQRLASGAEAQVLRKERDALSEKLDKFSSTVNRIAALRKKCASQGKSLADEIGESTALQLNDAESKQKENIAEQQKKLDTVEVLLKKIEENLADAYEQECILRDEQQKSQDNLQNQGQIESTLQKELQDEQRKLAETSTNLTKCEAQQKVVSESLAETEKELAKLKEQFSELYNVDLTRKENQDQLQQQINELQQENAALLTKRAQDTKPKPTVGQENSGLEESQQQLLIENTTLREKLQACTRQVTGLQTNETVLRTDASNFLEQIRALSTQVEELKTENLALHKKDEEYIAAMEGLQRELKKSEEDAANAAIIGQRLLNQIIKEQNEQQ